MNKLFLITCLTVSSSCFAGISNFMAWPISEINVCFAGKGTVLKIGAPDGFANWNEKQKEYIKNVLDQEFTPERTGYHFVGFADCDSTANPDVVVVRKPNYSPHALSVKGQATVGRSLLIPSPTYKTARGAVLFTATGIKNNATITHEFGHILGLKHEHEHPDAKEQSQSWCIHYTKTEHRYYNMYTPFDEGSVMNYCTALRDSKSGLSQGDVEHIRALYNYSSIVDKKKFN